MKGTGESFHSKVLSTNKKYNATDKKLVSDPFSLNKNISNAKSSVEEHPNGVNRKTVMFKQTENDSMLNRSRQGSISEAPEMQYELNNTLQKLQPTIGAGLTSGSETLKTGVKSPGILKSLATAPAQ